MNFKKYVLVMKLTSLLMIIALMQVSAAGLSQVTLQFKDAPMEKVLESIKEQTGYFIFYQDKNVKMDNVSISMKNAPLRQALDSCFKNQAVRYKIIGKTIALSKALFVTATEPQSTLQPNVTIRGRVVDSTGRPLEGAAILEKGTQNNTQSNTNGAFELSNIHFGDTLRVSYIGYVSREIRITKQTSYFYIVMQPSDNELDKTIVEAYGTTSRRFNIGSIATVDAASIEKQPVTNPLLALAGQAPGLAVNATSGVPGSKVMIQIRGQNTLADMPNGLKTYDQPLFIIDGVPFAPQNNNISQLSNLASAESFSGGISQAGGISPFDNINPQDIQSISILKDADATSIYGTQGSNGVVIITTKTGASGNTNFNLNINSGFNSSIRQIKLLNTQQYLQLRAGAFAADGKVPGNDPNDYNSYAPDLTVFGQQKYTDWYKTIFGKTANQTTIHGTLSGGTNNNTFLVSGGYSRSNYNYPGSGYANQAYTLHSSLSHTSINNRFSIRLITDYAYSRNNSPGFGGVQKVLLAPNTPDLLNPAGGLLWSYSGVDLSNYQFYAYLKKPVVVQSYNLNSSLQLSYKIAKGLSIRTNLGYSRNTTDEHSKNPAAAQNPLYANRSTQFASNNYETINIEPQLNYDTHIGKGSLNILLGGTYKKNTNNQHTLEGIGYSNDDFLGSINGAVTVHAYDGSSIYKYSAGFARIKYIYAQKYIINLTGNRDGSSNFGPGNRFGNFGSMGAAWIFSEENGFKKELPFISFGKLSGSYGTSGSDGVQPYMYQPLWEPNSYYPSFQGVVPNFPKNLYNPDYSWALKKSLNLALDIGLFNDRILLDATYYRDRQGNQLAGYPLPAQTGFSSVEENIIASIQNQGWEFSFTSKNVESKHFSWSTNFNISFNRNKLLSFPNLASSSYYGQYVIGKPTSVIIGYRYKGVNPTTGLFEFYAADGQVTSDPVYGMASRGGDQVAIGDREVDYMGGLGNTLSFDNFSLYFFFQFSSQMAPTWLNQLYSSNPIGASIYNVPLAVLNNYWKVPGDQALLQKLTSSYSTEAGGAMGDFSQSTGAYANDTYARLKTVALSYALPKSFVKKLHMQGCSVYVNAQNVLTITNYKVGDPEMFGYASFPLQRTIAFGLNLNF